MIPFTLTKQEQITLLKIARNTLLKLFHSTKNQYEITTKETTPNLKSYCGVFVSLYNNDTLRGCIGSLTSSLPLTETLISSTISAAKNDSRFPPITAKEINEISIELSILTPLEKIYSLNNFELGKHGIYIKKGGQSGTFLPQVASQTNWTKEEFLGNCSKNKAGLTWDGWKSAEVYRYEAIVIKESKFNI
ncbi:MAG: AmmeMemoRadiSam system protein A [Prolixibacteraceae bacterium]|jgi:AmmeMemoRadiSam system protein A|nr:AmmeMemoRadiSam system protein A [Prolixibacteraceae bacterium]